MDQRGSILVLSKTFARSVNAISLLQNAGYSVRVVDAPLEEQGTDWLHEQLDEELAVVVGHNVIDETTISRAAQLRMIAKQGTGVDNIDIHAATQFGHRRRVEAGVR
jgi:phosphoglycerate dehydrogenase-like enzyme